MLKRVKIQGYKSLEDVEVHLQPLSVLFGQNASGKSNFLEALQLLSKIATSSNLNDAFRPPYRGKPLESFTLEPNGLRNLLARDKASFSIEVDVKLSQTAIDAVQRQIELIQGKSKESPLREKYLRYRVEIETVPKTGILRIANESLIALKANGSSKKETSFLSAVYDLEHGVLVGWSIEGQHNDIRNVGAGAYESSSLLAARYSPFLQPHLTAMHEEFANWFFYALEPREYMRTPTPAREVLHIGLRGEEIDAFLNTLRTVNEPQFDAVEKALHLFIRAVTGINVSVNNAGEVDLKVMQGQTAIPLLLISDGTLRVLGLLAIASTRERPALLGIEEPENSIHPTSLDLIARFLETRAWSNEQVIATTHSPGLIDILPQESLYVTRKVGEKTVIEPFAAWKYPDTHVVPDEEGDTFLPELTVSERVLRGDFNANN